MPEPTPKSRALTEPICPCGGGWERAVICDRCNSGDHRGRICSCRFCCPKCKAPLGVGLVKP